MIAIGSDHGGVELKDYLVAFLCSSGVDVRDFGTQGSESVDYPDFSREVALRVAQGHGEVCGADVSVQTVAPVCGL